jgi:hypothetical protein
MKTELDLYNATPSDDRLPLEVIKDYCEKSNIYIFKDLESLEEDDTRAFSLWLNYGENGESLMFDVDLNDLEMFANSILKSIEMLRRDYPDVIKNKIKKGFPL